MESVQFEQRPASAPPGNTAVDSLTPQRSATALMTETNDSVPVAPAHKKFKFLSKEMQSNAASQPAVQVRPKSSADELNEYINALKTSVSNTDSGMGLGDPIEYWVTHATRFPNLSGLALDIICAPASEAYAQRVFSVCGQLTTGKSNRTAKNLQRRVFSQSELRL